MGFTSKIIALESGGKNITNTTQGTSSGNAQGYFQITTGTWKDFAPRAGVDLSQYPTALSAPYDVQSSVAGIIPMSRWDPKTISGLTGAGYSLNLNKTLAENVALNNDTLGSALPISGKIPGGGAGLPGPAGALLSPIGKELMGTAPGITKDNPIGTMGEGAGTAQGVFVGTAGTVAVEDLAKQVKIGAKEQADASAQAAKDLAAEATKDTGAGIAAGTSWWEYFGYVLYELLPRAGTIGLGIVLIGLALWMLKDQQPRTA